jgi:hypothetical protein
VVLTQGNNTLENLTITGGGSFSGGIPAAALRIEGSNVTLRGNRILDNPNYGVHVWWTAGAVTIERNLFLNNSLGVQLPQDQTLIRYNTFVNNQIAINILDGKTATVEYNIITGSSFQSIYEFKWGGTPTSGYATVRSNTLYQNTEKGGHYSISLPPNVLNQTNGNNITDPLFMVSVNGPYDVPLNSPAYGRGAYAPTGGAMMMSLTSVTPPRPASPSKPLEPVTALPTPVSKELESYLVMKQKKIEERKLFSPVPPTPGVLSEKPPVGQ